MYAQPYSTYKPINVDWLGEVPDHWEVLRLKSVVHQVSDQVYGSQEKIPYVALEHVESWTGRVSPHVAEKPDSQLKQFRSGDVLFGKLRPYLAKVVRAKHSGLCVSEFLVLRTTDRISERFLAYLLRSKPAIDWINSSTFGARMPRADWQFVGDTKQPLPSLSEQTAIARFLDHATDQTERYIRAKEKLIALLEEQKQVMIHDAVTGRIDVRTGKPYPAYKPSGIEGKGCIPNHWNQVVLRNVSLSIQIGPFGSQLHASDYVKDGIPVINPSHLINGKIVPNPSVTVTEKFAKILGQYRLKESDVVMARRGELGRCAAAESNEEGWICGTGCIRVRPNLNLVTAMYLVATIGTHETRHALGLSSIGATMDNINTAIVSRLRLALPPLDEQQDISDHISNLLRSTSSAISQTRMQIEAITEYRVRLIADVVTGKLDVREAAANLPELEAIADTGGQKTPAASDSQQSNTTLHNEAPPTTPGVGS